MTDSPHEVLTEALTDAVYAAALAPAAWHDVMQQMRACFPSVAQTFYFLDRATKHIRPVCLSGVQPRWVASFDEFFFTADNPWIKVTRQLHRPGVVRTTERLERFMHDEGVLDRSAYYNDWMRPQGFKHNIGNTLLAEEGVVANITLFRSPDMPTFSDAEVAAFEVLSRHTTRALRMSVQLERNEHCPAGTAAFDALPQAVALVDPKRRVVYANAAMQALLRRARGLCLRQGVLVATDAPAEQRLAALVAAACGGAAQAPAGDAQAVFLPAGANRLLSLHAIPVQGAMAQYLPARRTLLLTVRECAERKAPLSETIDLLYACTPAEARLARLLVEGRSLRDAAQALGVTYGTARTTLKIVFQKTGVRSQAQLVGRLLAAPAGNRL